MAVAQFWGTGRRKNAIARVRLLAGNGTMVINGRPLENYFPLESLRAQVLAPIKAAELEGRFDVIVKVEGGGVSGQAGAVRHGIARALLVVDPNFRVVLKRSGFLRRDARIKERRKYGLKKARKAPQFSKR